MGCRRETQTVHAVVAGLARLVEADGGVLVLRSYDVGRRELDVVLGDRAACAVDASVVSAFLTEVLCLHGIELAGVRVGRKP